MTLLLSMATLPALFAATPPSIIGGAPTDAFGAVGALVALDESGRSMTFCSTTLFDPTWAATAAHCVEGMALIAEQGFDRTFAVFGTRIDDESGIVQFAQVSRGVAHPDYDEESFSHDIAVLELAEPITEVTPIPLSEETLDDSWVGEPITYVGWGMTLDDSPETVGVKRTVEVPLYETRSTILITYGEGINTCQGDSGGAALAEVDDGYELVGVSSFVTNVLDGEIGCTG